MPQVSAQISLYPLRQEHLGPAIRAAVAELEGHGLEIEVGAMSTRIRGAEDVVFPALESAFHRASRQGEVVMVVTISNACPQSPRKDVSP